MPEGALEIQGIFTENEYLQFYNLTFKEPVRILKEKMKGGDGRYLSEYIGSGSTATVFRVEVDAHHYAMKILKEGSSEFEFEVQCLLKALSIEKVAHLYAYSVEDKVIVMDFVEGKSLENYTPKEAPYVKDEHIIGLVETVRKLYEKGLFIDPTPSNFLYNSEEGFTILDYTLKSIGEVGIGEVIIELSTTLWMRKFDQNSDGFYIEQIESFLQMMVRFLRILKNEYPEILDNYNQSFASKIERGENQTPIINKKDIPKDHPRLKYYLDELEQMGF